MLYTECTEVDLSLFKDIFLYYVFLLISAKIFKQSKCFHLSLIFYDNYLRGKNSFSSFWLINATVVELLSYASFVHFVPQTGLWTTLSF